MFGVLIQKISTSMFSHPAALLIQYVRYFNPMIHTVDRSRFRIAASLCVCTLVAMLLCAVSEAQGTTPPLLDSTRLDYSVSGSGENAEKNPTTYEQLLAPFQPAPRTERSFLKANPEANRTQQPRFIDPGTKPLRPRTRSTITQTPVPSLGLLGHEAHELEDTEIAESVLYPQYLDPSPDASNLGLPKRNYAKSVSPSSSDEFPILILDEQQFERVPLEEKKPEPLSKPQEAPKPQNTAPGTSNDALTPEQLKVREVRQVLTEGMRLEEQRSWSEAMQHYEKSLKLFSEDKDLLYRYRITRFRYEISKRYHDPSFDQLLEKTPLSELLELYGDAFSRLHDHHVDAPKWEALFRCGLDDLEIALREKEFLDKNKITATEDQIEQLCRKMRETSDPWSFRHIHDMKNGVLCVAELAQKEIGLSPAAVILEFICGAAFSLDPHTSYFTLRQLNDFNSMIEGRFVGIGVELDDEEAPLVVRKVHSHSPAHAAGVRNGDAILAVNGTSLADLSFEQAADLLQGGIGSTVTLRLKSRNERVARDVRIVRGHVEIASVEDVHMIDKEIGYIRLTCFQPSSADEMREALNSLQSKGMKTLILDLRRNPGGLLTIAVETANLFIEKGVIVRTRNRTSTSESVWNATPQRTWKMPLYVLIDEESASASEIFAGAIQDHKRGTIIGHQSYGKGTVQVPYRLTGSEPTVPLSGLKLTIERFYSPNGTPFCNVGVIPDLRPLEESEKVTLGKPDPRTYENSVLANSPLKPQTPKRRETLSGDPEDPFVAAALSEIYRSGPPNPLRVSHTRP